MRFAQYVACPLLVLILLGLSGNRDVTSLKLFEPTIDPGVAPTIIAQADTLRTTATPGTPLILTLPAELNGRSVERYSLLRGPALSGVAGRSFTWISQGAKSGMHEALLRTHAPNAPPDTLIVQINLQP